MLPTVVRYPAVGKPSGRSPLGATPDVAAGPFPLIVFSHGYDISAESYSALLEAWARAGYVVADPTYPFTDSSTPGGLSEADIVNHPADLRYAISALLSAGRQHRSPFHDLLDDREVAVVGHSDGGDAEPQTRAARARS